MDHSFFDNLNDTPPVVATVKAHFINTNSRLFARPVTAARLRGQRLAARVLRKSGRVLHAFMGPLRGAQNCLVGDDRDQVRLRGRAFSLTICCPSMELEWAQVPGSDHRDPTMVPATRLAGSLRSLTPDL